MMSGAEGRSFHVEFSRGSVSGVPKAEFQYWTSTGPDEPVAETSAALSVTDFKLRVIYCSAKQQFESRYDDTGAGTNWKLLRITQLAGIAPNAIATSEFAVGLLANTYYGPISEGQIWADDFRLVNALLDVPIISTQPANQSVTTAVAVTLSVVDKGTGLTYQWRKNGINISGATNSSYTIANTQLSHAGSYSVVVSNTNGGVTSSAATLTVNARSGF